MKKDKFEKYVHDVFADHSIPLDTNELFKTIEKDLPPKKRSFPWAIFLITGLILVAGGFVYSHFVLNDYTSGESRGLTATQDDSPSVKTQSLIQNPTSTADDQGLEKNETSDLINTPAQNQKIASVPTKEEEEKTASDKNQIKESNTSASKAQLNEVKLNSNKRASSSQDGNKVTQENKLNIASTKTNSKELAVTSTPGKKSNVILSSTDGDSKTTQIVNLRDADIVKVGMENQDSKKSNFGLGLNNTLGVKLKTKQSANTSQTSRATFDLKNISNFSLANSFLAPLSQSIILPEGLLPCLSKCYSFKEGKSIALALDVYAGLHYAQKQLKNKGINSEVDYLSERENTETTLEGYDVGIGINAIHRKGFMASTGINYRQVNERFDYQWEKTETRFDSVITRVEIDSSGHRDTIKEWRPVTVKNSRLIETYNAFRMVEIPLTVGFQFHKGNWGFEAHAGVMFNLLFKQRGEILNSDLTIRDLETTKVFKDRIGLSALGSIKILYPINPGLSIYLEPYARINLKDLTIEDYEIDQRYNSYGLRLGGRFTF